MPNDVLIERCAAIADEVAARLSATKGSARQHRYDRQSGRQIDYAIRMVKRVAAGIRALKIDGELPQPAETHDGKLNEARALLREVLPSIKDSRNTQWKQNMLQRIQDILKD